ncbi:MAG: Rrf2 family transcriptional regulator [Ruminococcus sp.]|nr:Rrf2 family transcriptional regulator [Ruminococcus sp.]
MKISTKGRYSLRMLADLAIHGEEGYISLKDIAERQDISKKYLEQIVPLLSRSGIIKANRGNKGGYMINGKASELSIGDVLRATEGSLAPVACLEYEPNSCERCDKCPTISIWKELYRLITDYLDGISIQDLADKSISFDGNHYCI